MAYEAARSCMEGEKVLKDKKNFIGSFLNGVALLLHTIVLLH